MSRNMSKLEDLPDPNELRTKLLMYRGIYLYRAQSFKFVESHITGMTIAN